MDNLSRPFPFQSQADCGKVPKKEYGLFERKSVWDDWSNYFPDSSLPEQVSDTWLIKQYAVLTGVLPLIADKDRNSSSQYS